MFRRLAKWVLVVALTSSIGLHWVLFQSVAWAGMLVANLQRTAFTEAVQVTFDGKHPCPLCKAIAQGKKSEKKSEVPSFVKKFEFMNLAAFQVPAPPAGFALLPSTHSSGLTRPHHPPTPPPRLA